jgi:hypothetical protein
MSVNDAILATLPTSYWTAFASSDAFRRHAQRLLHVDSSRPVSANSGHCVSMDGPRKDAWPYGVKDLVECSFLRSAQGKKAARRRSPG